MNGALFLIISSLVLVMLRFWQPWVAKPSGSLIRTFVVPFRARVRLQRANVYAIAGLMILGGIGGWIPGFVQLLIMAAVVSLLGLPLSYTVTTEGIALGRTAMRPWSDFSRVDIAGGRAMLTDIDGFVFDVWLPVSNDVEAVIADLRRLVRGQRADDGERRRNSSKRRMGGGIAQRSI